jgi:hypothetical protein
VTKPKATDEQAPDALTEQELEEANGEPLPDRHALSLIRGAEPLPLPIVPDDGGIVSLDDPPPST